LSKLGNKCVIVHTIYKEAVNNNELLAAFDHSSNDRDSIGEGDFIVMGGCRQISIMIMGRNKAVGLFL
jgi:ribosomal protein S17